jgi:hypothetical protein
MSSMHWLGGGQFDPAFGLVNGPVKSRSTLVKLGQSSPNSGKCIPDPVLKLFGHGGPQSGQKRLGQTMVNPCQTSVKLGQSSSNSGECLSDHVSRVFGHGGPQSGQKRLGQTLVKFGQP